jgi:hypothetical protein
VLCVTRVALGFACKQFTPVACARQPIVAASRLQQNYKNTLKSNTYGYAFSMAGNAGCDIMQHSATIARETNETKFPSRRNFAKAHAP